MTAEATYVRDDCEVPLTAAAAMTPGQVLQLHDGRAGVVAGMGQAVASGDPVTAQVCGTFTLAKTASIVLLKGGRAYWDHSANKVHFKKVNDRDFYIGRVSADAASADTTVEVALNIDPRYDIDALRDGVLSVPTGTKAAGAFGYPKVLGGATLIELTATNEAQCIDMLSVDRFAIAANAIVEAIFRPAVNGSTSDVDFNIGVANGTSTSDADAITESVFVHIDGGALTVNAESDDGTTEVNATDTTKVIAAGSAVANRTEVWIDLRNSADIQIYVDGVNVLPNSTFTLAAAVGPLGLLAHLEKVSGTATGAFLIDALRARFMEQD